jgi:hypothetical protein
MAVKLEIELILTFIQKLTLAALRFLRKEARYDPFPFSTETMLIAGFGFNQRWEECL